MDAGAPPAYWSLTLDSRGIMGRLGLLYAALFAAVAVIYPFFAIYLDTRGFSPSRIGMLLGTMELAGLVASVTLSRLADRSGRFRGVMSAMAIFAAVALAILHRAALPLAVFSAVAMYGFFFKPLTSMADALAGRTLIDSTSNYGKARVWGTVSFVVLSLVLQATGLLADSTPDRFMTAFLMALVLVLVSIPAAPGAPPHDDGEPAGTGGFRGMPDGFYSFIGFCFLGNIGFAVYNAFGSLYFSEVVGVAAVSGLFALASTTEIPSLFYGGRILAVLGHRRMLLTAQAACILRLVILASFPSVWPVALSQTTHALCFGFFIISGVDWVNRIVPVRSRALGMSMFIASTFSGAQLVGSMMGGFLLEHAGFPVLFGVGAVFPLMGVIWLLIDRRIGDAAFLSSRGGS